MMARIRFKRLLIVFLVKIKKFRYFTGKFRILPVNDKKMKYDKFDSRRKLTNPQDAISLAKQQIGSTKDKFPVFLDGGKTIIFIADKNKEQETIERYKRRGVPGRI